MDNISKLQQKLQDGVVAAQSQKGMELSERALIESSRVNEVKPQPDGDTKVEEKKEGEQSFKENKKNKAASENEDSSTDAEDDDFHDPFKGTIIDTKR
ncbi:hypothetical protein LCGC14_2593520 [marine sediment metagenome]|uniref:Uncharacterized protein n=1 Tax=marine sediment metagenome TaxID=412755 RepID=A0A0F9D3I7_9ZZZZ|nr:hypothetical protein [Spirochaetota bacterium]